MTDRAAMPRETTDQRPPTKAAPAARRLHRRRFRSLIIAAFAAMLAVIQPAATAGSEQALWDALRSGGHVALLRHALAPGTGDPPEFTLGDCSTQRNLSDTGRAQARRIGERFRANGIDSAPVLTSQWCRCRETAELLGLGQVTDLPILNSFFQRPGQRQPQTAALRDWLGEQDLGPVHVLVTHQVNITALTGVYPSSGELVVVRSLNSGDVQVIGSIETD